MLDQAILLHQCNWLIFLNRSTGYLTNGDTTQKRRVIKRSNLHLQGTFFYFWLRNMFDDTIQQRRDVFAWREAIVKPTIFNFENILKSF